MGHFSYSCYLSGLPITSGTPAALIVMRMRDRLYDNSEKHLRKFGQTNLISNEGTQVKFQPVWFPIFGDYDDYGGLENIQKDDNTAILEEYYGLTIEQIIAIVTSGRKDDGYDGDLKVIKKPFNRPKDMKEGEDWFKYYQRTQNDPMPCGYPDVSGSYDKNGHKVKEKGYCGWMVWRGGKKVRATKEEYDADFKLIHEHYARYKAWCKENPDPTDDYGNPQYEERYKELLTYSGMWVHGTFYEELTKKAFLDDYDKVDLGHPSMMKALGFKEIGKDKSERYNRRFEKDGLVINSDGTWLNAPKVSLYTLPALKEYCEQHGVSIDIDKINKKDRTEQIFDYVIPNIKSIGQDKYGVDEVTEARKAYEKLTKEEKDSGKGKELVDIMLAGLDIARTSSDSMIRSVKYKLLNSDEYRFYNPMAIPYFNAAKEGKLRDNIVRFWRFDRHMYAAGKYYEIIGTSPQDGDRQAVMHILKSATKVLRKELKEREDW